MRNIKTFVVVPQMPELRPSGLLIDMSNDDLICKVLGNCNQNCVISLIKTKIINIWPLNVYQYVLFKFFLPKAVFYPLVPSQLSAGKKLRYRYCSTKFGILEIIGLRTEYIVMLLANNAENKSFRKL